MGDLIYLDHAATMPLHPAALEAMMPYLTTQYGNPSATYGLARHARDVVQRARASVASVLGARPAEVIFTGGGTESINTALKGVAFQQKKARAGGHIVTSAIEHHAVLHACQYLERFGFDVTYVPVNGEGMVDPDDVARAVSDRTVLVSIMAANNEVGTIQPIAEIAEAVRARSAALARRIPLHTDAIQAPNSMDLKPLTESVDLLSLAAHKFRGPKGVGVLYLRRGVPFLAQQNGGGQERQRRAGTEDVAGIVGTARALELTQTTLTDDRARVLGLSARLRDGIRSRIPGAVFNGDAARRLANNVSVTFPEAEASVLLEGLDNAGVACSAGAACGATTLEPSHVLLAMDISLEHALATLRFSLGPDTSAAEIDAVLDRLPDVVARSRASNRQPAPAIEGPTRTPALI